MSTEENRDTLRYHRQLDLIDIEKLQKTAFTIIGTGALGSFITITLAKMGAEDLTVFDFDKVETHNLPMQFYRQADLGKLKVEALHDIVQDFEGVEVTTHAKKFEGETDSEVVISAVDSLKARREIYAKLGPSYNMYIDSRAAGNVATIFTLAGFNPEKIAAYEADLEDDDVYEAPCTERMTTYIAPTVAGHVAAIVAQYCNGTDTGAFKRTLDMVNCLALSEEP